MNTETSATVNRQYKSSVFSMLFEDRTRAMSLYNALNGSHYSDPEELEIVTLESAIYMAMKNDCAFILDHRLNLYEHQSTPNPNMPLRHLHYVSREYEKLVESSQLYSSRKIKIPAPRFVVFYNGTRTQPERMVIKLSELYEIPEEDPMLELQVLFLNINRGSNEELKKACRCLGDYMEFVERIRQCTGTSGMTLEEAIEKVITECIREGILREFLLAHRAEVVSMSIFEYDEEAVLKVIRESEYQNGFEEGERIGLEEGKRASIMVILEELEPIPDRIREQILSERDPLVLSKLLKAAARVTSMEEFERQLPV